MMRTYAVILGMLFPALALPAAGAIDATASLHLDATTGSVSSPTYHYTVTLQNTGDTTIGTFWYAWIANPELDFLPSVPTVTSSPSGWLGSVSGGPGAYSIEWYNYLGSTIPAGGVQTFGFNTPDSPAILTGNSPAFSAYKTQTSFVYTGFPEADPGKQFLVAAPVAAPEPASLSLLGIGGVALLRRRRRA